VLPQKAIGRSKPEALRRQSRAVTFGRDMSLAVMNIVSIVLECPVQSALSYLLQQSDAVAARLIQVNIAARSMPSRWRQIGSVVEFIRSELRPFVSS